MLRCIFVQNLEIVTSIGGELWHAKVQNGVNFDFGVQFDLEGQGQSPPKTVGILTKVFYTHCPNLMILAWTGDELSRAQSSAYRTHRRTDGRSHRQTDACNDNTGSPKLASRKYLNIIIYIWCSNLTCKVANIGDCTLLSMESADSAIAELRSEMKTSWLDIRHTHIIWSSSRFTSEPSHLQYIEASMDES